MVHLQQVRPLERCDKLSELDVVFATTTANVATNEGRPIMIIYGTHWPADDPIVQKYPGMFSNDPKYGLYATSNPYGGSVEEATATPGERRRGPGRPRADVK